MEAPPLFFLDDTPAGTAIYCNPPAAKIPLDNSSKTLYNSNIKLKGIIMG